LAFILGSFSRLPTLLITRFAVVTIAVIIAIATVIIVILAVVSFTIVKVTIIIVVVISSQPSVIPFLAILLVILTFRYFPARLVIAASVSFFLIFLIPTTFLFTVISRVPVIRPLLVE
jgi:hypothetical protein